MGTWNVRSMNQDKLEVVKQEMARVNVNILGISELKWTGMGEFNSDDHYIYYCGQESLRRNGVAIMCGSRSSAHGKGHEEGDSAYAKAGSSLRSTPWKFSSIYPQNQSLPTFCFVLSPIPLTLWGAVPHYLPLKKRVNLQLQLIKFLDLIVFQPTNSFGSPLACLNRFFWPHVIAQSLPTMRGMRCSKLSKYRFL